MRRLILKRLGLMVVMLLGLAVITFTVANVAPGDPARLAAGPDASQEMVEQIRVERGFDRALPVRFAIYIGNLVQGDLGTSVYTGREVAQDVAIFLPATVELVLFSIFIAIVLGVPLGVLAAVWQNKAGDHAIRLLSVSGVALPMFWLGLMLVLVLAIRNPWFPATGYTPISESLVGWWQHIALPAFTLGLAAAAILTRQLRGAMVDVMQQDYVRTAKAKGLPYRKVVAKHALKNAAIPMVTILGLQANSLLGGTI
ncbi:ABC transporter permease, partial [Marivita sp.]|uniref:ABC transporter permease n=1 Tax=Marivita sp. TaxID=2003365 RepID=UPI0025C35953